MYIRKVPVLLLFVFTISSPAFSDEEKTKLTILHTSDMHGSVLPFDDTQNSKIDHSLAQVSTLVESVRSSVKHPVILVDSGDTIQGTPFEFFTTVRQNEASPTITTMNRLGYEAMAVGNHEFNFGLDILRNAESLASFPFLSANTIDEKSGKPAFQPFKIVEAGKLRIGILGLTTPNIPGWEKPEHYRGLRFEPMDESARFWVTKLRDDEGCDLVIVLAHTGIENDPATSTDQPAQAEDYGRRLSQVPGIDLLLTGHAHKNIPPKMLGTAITSQPSSYARIVSRIDLDLEKIDGKWSIASWTGENIPTKDFPADPKIEKAMYENHQKVVEALDQPITNVIGNQVSVEGCRIRDCAALDLIHSVQLEATGADLSLAAILSNRTPVLEPGKLTWRWVYGLYIYPNTLNAVIVTGAQVKDILEYSARYYTGIDCSGRGGCRIMTDPEIYSINVDTIAGLSYRIDPTQAIGNRVYDLRFQDQQLDENQRFSLACNNYRAAGGGGFPHLQDAEVIWTSSSEMSELIGAYLEKKQTWQPVADQNWRIEPRFFED